MKANYKKSLRLGNYLIQISKVDSTQFENRLLEILKSDVCFCSHYFRCYFTSRHSGRRPRIPILTQSGLEGRMDSFLDRQCNLAHRLP